MAMLAMTSFAFILLWVPEPVCHMDSGQCSLYLPATTSLAAVIIRFPILGSNLFCFMFTLAAANLIIPSAFIIESGCFSQPMGKFIIERCVCAPQYFSLDTCISPKLSVSTLKLGIFSSKRCFPSQ